ncbi:MAG: PorP/SprF family type IX secretion system membrane protein [Flavobacteriales bacterium]|nr:PorP/SprF family type IX secretion system membrane protein [Flavobacteriales bacterium]
MKQVIFLLLLPIIGYAQQDPQFTLNNDLNSFTNPSFMVNDYKLNATVQNRQQWVGFDGAPITTLANVSYRVDKAWSAFGLTYLNDQLGAQTTNAAYFNYAFDGKIGKHHIVPSIQLGLLFNTLDGSQLNPIQGNDPNIINSSASDMNFDMGLGIAYRFQGIAVGFSIRHLNGASATFETANATSQYTLARNYYGIASYEALIGRVFRMKPVAIIRSDGASTQFDQFLWIGTHNLNRYFDGVSLGVGYRVDDAVMVGIEFKLKWFTLGYSYDITTSGLNNYSNGSHEGYLRIHLFKKRESDSGVPE